VVLRARDFGQAGIASKRRRRKLFLGWAMERRPPPVKGARIRQIADDTRDGSIYVATER